MSINLSMSTLQARLERLPFNQKIRLLPIVAGAALALILATNLAVGVRSDARQQRLHTGYYPALATSEKLVTLLSNAQRALQDAVAAADTDRLAAADSLRDAFLARVAEASSNPVMSAEDVAGLRDGFRGYYDQARATSVRFIGGETGTQLSTALDSMVKSFKATKQRIDDNAVRQQREIESEVASTRRLARAGLAIEFLITLLTLVLLTWTIRAVMRSLSSQVASAARVADQLAQGDVTVVIPPPTDDELGKLLASMGAMVAYLREMAEVAEAIASGKLSVEITPRSSVDRFGIAFRDMASYLREMAAVAGQIAQGRLDARITPRSSADAFGTAFVSMLDRLSQLVSDLGGSADAIASAASELASAAQSLSQGAADEANSVQDTVSSLDALNAAIAETVRVVQQMEAFARDGAKEAQESGQSMSEAVTAMSAITDRVRVIDQIAGQTNLLALNAAIEAARAGENGRGFAVVADEVRKLAEHSSRAAKEINSLAATSHATVESSGGKLASLVPRILRTSEIVDQVATSATEQAQRVSHVGHAMEQVDEITQRNAASAQELAAMAEELTAQSESLQHMLASFRGVEEGRRPVRAPAGTPIATRGRAPLRSA